MELIIVNLTTKSFFRYSMKNEKDEGYNKQLLGLLTPPHKDECSHWFKKDNIVFCPEHLKAYICKNYGEIYV